MSTTVSILTYNRKELLDELLSALRSKQRRLRDIIVVDNHSQDGTEELVRSRHPEVTYLRMSQNLGATARNYGLRRAESDVVICLDDDIFGLDDESIAKIEDMFRTRPELAAINFRILDHQTMQVCNWVHHRHVHGNSESEFETYEITEGAVAFRRAALAEVGFYPENFFLSHEGPDLALRLMDRGYSLIYTGAVSVVHCHSQLGRKTWLNYYYDTRNLFLVAIRNYPVGYGLWYLARGLSAMLVYSLRDGYFLHWLRALRDGVVIASRSFGERKTIGARTLARLKEIDRHRPSVGFYIVHRLLRSDARL